MNNPEVSAAEARDGEDACVVMESPGLSIWINVEFGSHIFRVVDRATGVNLLHEDPRGSSGYGIGGWYLLFPNAGPACVVGDTAISAHGDIQGMPWQLEELTEEGDFAQVRLRSQSTELPFTIQRTVRLNRDDVMRVSEKVTNIGVSRHSFLWGHHPTFGEAMMGPDARILLPGDHLFAEVKDVGSPREAGTRGKLHAMRADDGSTTDLTRVPQHAHETMLFSERLPEHWYEISTLEATARVDWDGNAFPYLWLWSARDSVPQEPGIRALALEPQSTNVPGLADAVRAGQAPCLEPGGSASAWVEFTYSRKGENVNVVAETR